MSKNANNIKISLKKSLKKKTKKNLISKILKGIILIFQHFRSINFFIPIHLCHSNNKAYFKLQKISRFFFRSRRINKNYYVRKIISIIDTYDFYFYFHYYIPHQKTYNLLHIK